MEGKQLHPTEDPDGTHIFTPVEVFQVAKERARRAIDPSKAGERDARAFELLDAGHDIRHLVTTLRIPVDVAKHISSAWQEAGRNDIVVPRPCKTEIERTLGQFRDAAELVQRVRVADAESDRICDELARVQNCLGNLVAVIGEIAARTPAMAIALPEIRAAIDDETVHVFDHALEHATKDVVGTPQRKPAPSEETPGSVAKVPNSEASRTLDEDKGKEVVPVVAEVEAAAANITTSALAACSAAVDCAGVTDLERTANGTRAATNAADRGPCAEQSLREELLDAWLHGVAEDDAQLQRLAKVLVPAETVMLAELASTIGTGVAVATESRSPREQLLDALLASLTTDEARLEQVEAVLNSNVRDMFAKLRVHDLPPSRVDAPLPAS
jgi:hypothetical protein